ncbi:hypothetical protein NQ315_004254 [Exocentrus adspersus]|uniref:C2H2-type domain-containing protein n=1 Tax=Exocentrus adspersus TaxID=1586481 RepID=A0AAV8W873_9CUCU|nr:hypothetical protein NQ315_004254 [Exocentrus adspersus]
MSRVNDESSKLTCLYCDKVFKEKRRLNKHLLSHSTERPFACNLCDKRFKRKYDINIHMRVHGDHPTFECDICLKTLKSKGAFVIHRKRHLKQYVAKCEICGRGFVTNQEYHNHVASKHGTSNHICSICGRGCYDKAALQGHMARHEEDYGVNKNIKLKNTTNMKTENFSVLEGQKQMHNVCATCGKVFAYAKSLKKHLVSHGEERPFPCHLCNKKFKRRYQLSTHIKVHDGSLSFECDLCLKKLRSRSSLITHRKLHLKDYVARCELCNQGFYTIQQYTNHMGAKHTSSSFVCNICGRSCYDKASLQGHMKRHSKDYGSVKFQCELCDKEFLQERYLKQHHVRMHKNGGQRYVCDHCGKKVGSKTKNETVFNLFAIQKNEALHKSKKNLLTFSYSKTDFKFFHYAYSRRSTFRCKSRKKRRSRVKKETEHSRKAETCDVCGKSFTDTRKLTRHVISHSEERPYSCNLCGKQFKRKYQVAAHIRVHDGNMSFECDFCSKKLRSKGSWMIHRRRHLKDYVAKCEVCGQGFVTNQEYSNHMGSKHNTSNHICNICGRGCYDKGVLKSHMARHADNYETNQSIKCDICDKTFLQEKYLRQHVIRIHRDGGQKYMCDFCGKNLNSKGSLKNHIYIHKGVRPVECKECGKNFVLKTTLKLHMRTHTGERPYSCKVCGKSFTQRGPLHTHLLYHTGERPHKCEICSMGFVTKTLLVSHNKKHHDVMCTKKQGSKSRRSKSVHFCTVCGKVFTDVRCLSRHLVVHSEERPFACNICPMKFKLNHQLSAHARVHNESLSYECDFCLKKLRSKGSWVTHRRRHTKDFIARCEICDQGFVTSQEYTRHVDSKHGMSSHTCTICRRGFYNKHGLQSHMARHATGYSTNEHIRCELCNKTFLQAKYLKDHFHRVHKDGGQRFVCHHCGKEVNSRGSLRDHLLIHEGQTTRQSKNYRQKRALTDPECVIPKPKKEPKEELTDSEEEYPEDTLENNLLKFACELCEEQIQTSIDFAIHSIKHSPDNKYYCHHCQYKTTTAKRIRNHMWLHGNNRKFFKCETCTTVFPEWAQAMDHKNFHSGEMPYECETCGKHFMYSWLLFTHRRLLHWESTGGTGPFMCAVCSGSFGTRFFNSSILNNLIYGPGISITPIKQESSNCPATESNKPAPFNGYNGYNPFINQFLELDAKFQLPNAEMEIKPEADSGNILDCLDKANKVKKKPKNSSDRSAPQPPTIDEPIHCETCNETYKNNVAFALHSIQHAQDEKYECHLCDYRNSSKYHIEMHIRAHEGTTKYKCEICGKAFTVSTHAIEHKYFHTGEKPFQCEICGKHFMFSWFLTSHRRTQHWEIMTGSPLVKYDCTICNKHYTSSTGLKRHNLSKHNSSGIDPSDCRKKLDILRKNIQQ